MSRQCTRPSLDEIARLNCADQQRLRAELIAKLLDAKRSLGAWKWREFSVGAEAEIAALGSASYRPSTSWWRQLRSLPDMAAWALMGFFALYLIWEILRGVLR